MNDINDSSTFRLFARPSFLEGISRIVDMSGSLQVYNRNQTAREADYEALIADWCTVGGDLGSAIDEYVEKEQ